MILQYFKKKENEYKIKSDKIYLNILNKSKTLVNRKYFNKIDFSISFELICILLIFHLKFLKDKNAGSKKRVNDELMKNLVNDLDKSLRDAGISDMSIGKYVKKYVNGDGSYQVDPTEHSDPNTNGKVSANTWACNQLGITNKANCVQWDDNHNNITAFKASDLGYIGVDRDYGITSDDINCFKTKGGRGGCDNSKP